MHIYGRLSFIGYLISGQDGALVHSPNIRSSFVKLSSQFSLIEIKQMYGETGKLEHQNLCLRTFSVEDEYGGCSVSFRVHGLDDLDISRTGGFVIFLSLLLCQVIKEFRCQIGSVRPFYGPPVLGEILKSINIL